MQGETRVEKALEGSIVCRSSNKCGKALFDSHSLEDSKPIAEMNNEFVMLHVRDCIHCLLGLRVEFLTDWKWKVTLWAAKIGHKF